MKWITIVLEIIKWAVEWFRSPERRRRKAIREADEALAKGDEKRVNEILDRHLGR